MFIFDPGLSPIIPPGATDPFKNVAPVLIVAFAAVISAVFSFGLKRNFNEISRQETSLGDRRTEYEQKVVEQPTDPKLAWDLARVTLEQYFYRNLSQVTQIFYTAVGVMIVGFCFILFGSCLAIHEPT